jgi:hypothetical protein
LGSTGGWDDLWGDAGVTTKRHTALHALGKVLWCC